jgi:hypothetical protein
VVAAYTAANNQANKLREDSLLGAIETGSSYQMDAGGYQFLRASDHHGRNTRRSASYVPFGNPTGSHFSGVRASTDVVICTIPYRLTTR